ncbi:MAG: helix-turn-helix domain-containing protein [Hyphomicrobiaceae bacterium]
MTRIIDPTEMAAAFAEAAEVVRSGSREQRSGRVRPVGPVTALRQRLELSRKDFAERYHIPLGTLDAWERGTTEPDAVALAYLQLIEAEPETVARLMAERTCGY